MTMNIQVKNNQGITIMPLETRLMASRWIFIESEIDEQTASQFVKQVMALKDEAWNQFKCL